MHSLLHSMKKYRKCTLIMEKQKCLNQRIMSSGTLLFNCICAGLKNHKTIQIEGSNRLCQKAIIEHVSTIFTLPFNTQIFILRYFIAELSCKPRNLCVHHILSMCLCSRTNKSLLNWI